MKTTVAFLGGLATSKLIDGADHSFHVLARSGRTDPEAMAGMLDDFAEWVRAIGQG